MPLYSIDRFKELAPPEAVVNDDHQLMLNRLSFELAERQRLDSKKKELALEKEELLKESKKKQATYDKVKSQVDKVIKVSGSLSVVCHL